MLRIVPAHTQHSANISLSHTFMVTYGYLSSITLSWLIIIHVLVLSSDDTHLLHENVGPRETWTRPVCALSLSSMPSL